MTENNLCQFSENECKHKQMNAVTVSFDTTMKQMTEMSQRPRCLRKKLVKCLSEKKTGLYICG